MRASILGCFPLLSGVGDLTPSPGPQQAPVWLESVPNNNTRLLACRVGPGASGDSLVCVLGLLGDRVSTPHPGDGGPSAQLGHALAVTRTTATRSPGPVAPISPSAAEQGRPWLHILQLRESCPWRKQEGNPSSVSAAAPPDVGSEAGPLSIPSPVFTAGCPAVRRSHTVPQEGQAVVLAAWEAAQAGDSGPRTARISQHLGERLGSPRVTWVKKSSPLTTEAFFPLNFCVTSNQRRSWLF